MIAADKDGRRRKTKHHHHHHQQECRNGHESKRGQLNDGLISPYIAGLMARVWGKARTARSEVKLITLRKHTMRKFNWREFTSSSA
mmetsp:Transcript_12276/g.27081  ORF Transcript_12276/g.27081 Transcript_12276/m.27081 type:complete len:86 (-) Transcript_12276:809-1066(-)